MSTNKLQEFELGVLHGEDRQSILVSGNDTLSSLLDRLFLIFCIIHDKNAHYVLKVQNEPAIDLSDGDRLVSECLQGGIDYTLEKSQVIDATKRDTVFQPMSRAANRIDQHLGYMQENSWQSRDELKKRQRKEHGKTLHLNKELQSQDVNIDHMIQTNEIVVLQPKDNIACSICDNKWTDKNQMLLYRFTKTDCIAHHNCLKFAKEIHTSFKLETADDFCRHRNAPLRNRAGVFQVWIKRALDLPSVQWFGKQNPFATACLLPWNEPVHTKVADGGGKNPVWEDAGSDDNIFKLLHPYNSASTPIPQLKIDILNSTYFNGDSIAFNLYDLSPLLRYPNIVAERFFQLRDNSGEDINASVLVAIKFEPGEDSKSTSELHKFRAHSMSIVGMKFPVCPVCERVIVMGVRGGGFRCEICKLDVHQSCMMQAKARIKCKLLASRKRSYTNSDMSESNLPVDKSKNFSTDYKGTLVVSFRSAHICTKGCNDSAHDLKACTGDYYCRIKFEQSIHETESVLRNSSPVFDLTLNFDVTSYLSVLRLEVVELKTNVVCGQLQIPLMEVLQRKADHKIKELSCRNYMHEYYSISHGDYTLHQPKSSDVSGYCNLEVTFSEDMHSVLNSLSAIPSREEKEFSVEATKANIVRWERMLYVLFQLEVWYFYIISWKNVPFSGACCGLFIITCLRFNADYAPALIFYSMSLYLLLKLLRRLDGRYYQDWVELPDMEELKETRDIPYRGVGQLKIAPIMVEMDMKPNSSSRNGMVFIEVLYEPKDFPIKGRLLNFVESGKSQYFIGRSHNIRRAKRPTWRDLSNIVSHVYGPTSPEADDSVLSNVYVSWPHRVSSCECSQCGLKRESNDRSITEGIDHHAIRYPILQPAQHTGSDRQVAVPWTEVPGVLKFNIMYPPSNGTGTGSDRNDSETFIAGHATLPLQSLIQKTGQSIGETNLWIPVLCRNQARDVPTSLCIRIELEIPKANSNSMINRAYANALKGLLRGNKGGIAYSLLDKYRKVRDTPRFVQNELGKVCEKIEALQNLMNWTHPWKSGYVLLLFVALSLLFSVIPARYILLIGGLSEFGAALRSYKPPINRLKTVFFNLLASLPTMDEVLQTYSKERHEHLAHAANVAAEVEKSVLLLKLSCQWAGSFQTRAENDKQYKSVFGVYRLNRIVYWKTKEDAEAGLAAMGQLLLQPLLNSSITPRDLDQNGTTTIEFSLFGNTGDLWQEKRWIQMEKSKNAENLLELLALPTD